MPEFTPFPKIPRLRRTVTVTEKIDGTNGAVLITEGYPEDVEDLNLLAICNYENITQPVGVYAQSRNRFVRPGQDNAGFANYVQKNAQSLVNDLGVGLHFGEWWGVGIQRGYDMIERRFSLFNTRRWERRDPDGLTLPDPGEEVFQTPGLHVVPRIITHDNMDYCVDFSLDKLRNEGSLAAPGYGDPEGIVVYHHASNHLFKVTLKNDEMSKTEAEAA